MKLKVKVNESDYFEKVLVLLSNIPPFSRVRPKELKLYALILSQNHKHRRLPLEDRNDIIFTYASKVKMSKALGIKVSSIYNLFRGLRRSGLLDGDNMIPKYIISKTPSIIFEFYEGEE